MQQRIAILTGFLAGMMVLGLIGLGVGASYAQDASATPPPTNTPRATASPTPNPPTEAPPTSPPPAINFEYPIGPREYPEGVNRFTGLPFPDEASANRRNLIIKISNFPEVVRPQYGLSAADVVFEYEVEGGVTRFAAVYRANMPTMIGPVRSARLVDLVLVDAYQALLGYSGANEWIYDYILASEWRWRAMSPQIGTNCPMFCRIRWDSRPYEHTLFANTEAIWLEAERLQVNQAVDVRGLAFHPAVTESNRQANDIQIDWYNERAETRWQYDPASNQYLRFDAGLPHIDAMTDEQLRADNVVIMEVWHQERPDIFESEIAGIVIEHALYGTGTAWIFRDGNWYQGEWFRNQEFGAIYFRYLDADQTPIYLRPGQTWIAFVRKFYPGSTNALWSVTVSEDRVDAQATAVVQSERLTAVPAATQTQFAEWYGSPTPSATWTPTPTGTWQLGS